MNETDFINQQLTQSHQLTIVYFKDGSAHSIEKKHKKLSASFANYYYIGENTALLPFLTVEENLLIGIAKKKLPLYQRHLAEWADVFKINKKTCSLPPDELSQETRLLLQLIRGLALQRSLLFLDEFMLDLSEDFLENLIPILKKIAIQQDISIILLTEKEALTHTYPESIIVIDNSVTPG